MKADTVLDFAVFQLTPTRTRCELLISSNGVTEKLASSLVKPFLSHLRAAEEQIAAGGYSIKLEPPSDDEHNNSWFTKGTVQRFVRFVNTPEVLERVSAVESELLRLEDELRAYYSQEADDHSLVHNNSVGKSAKKLVKQNSVLEDCEPEANETSRSRLLKAMEARQSVLQKEQGMAFARAIAAGFDMDHLPDLIAFADHFGAARLREACLKLAALCKKQEEGGLWLDEIELVAQEGAFAYADTNGAGIDTFSSTKDVVDEDDSSSLKFVDHQRRSSGSFPDHTGMPPGMPPYPWMQFGGEHGYDPRFFPPQNMIPPYVNGNYPPPYWQPPPGSFNGHPGSVNNEMEEEEEEKTTAKKKSSPRRRTSSPLKKIQVGRSGKRSGMVLIRNINYIAKQNGSEKDNSDEASDESSSEEAPGTLENLEKHIAGIKRKPRKKTKSKKSASSEGSHSGTGTETFVMPERSTSGAGLESSNETFVMPERSTSHYGAGHIDFDTETNMSQQKKSSNNPATNDTFILDGARVSRGAGSNGQYQFDELASGRVQASTDGLMLPDRLGGRPAGSSNYESELAFDQGKPTVDDSFILPERGDQAHQNKGGYQVYGGRPNDQKQGIAAEDELFIVPSRNTHDDTRRALELDEQILYTVEKPKAEAAPKFEAEDMFILPDRPVEKERWTDIDYDMEAVEARASLQTKQEQEKENVEESEFLEQYQEQRDAKLMQESGSKKAEREAKMKALQDTIDKRKAEISVRFKATRSSILKSKKQREEEERKRIEELEEQRRNRIAARSGGNSAPRTPISSRSSVSGSRPPSRAPSTNKANNPLTRSVSSVSALGLKPKPQDGKAGKTSAAPSSEDRAKAKLQTRKSIASIRELKKPEPGKDKPKVSGPPKARTSIAGLEAARQY